MSYIYIYIYIYIYNISGLRVKLFSVEVWNIYTENLSNDECLFYFILLDANCHSVQQIADLQETVRRESQL
jgi:hypothetical protein